MNIAVIRRKYDPCGGGAEKYAAYVVDELIKRGHSVTVFAEKAYNAPDAVTIVSVPRSVFPSLCRTASFAKQAKKCVNTGEFDVVFAMSRYVGADVYRQAEQLHAVWMPIYYSYLSRFNPRHSGILALERRVMNDTDTGFVITNSELVRSQIIDTFGFNPGQVGVIRNGVDRNRFMPADTEERKILRANLGFTDSDTVLLFVAGNFKIKGLDKAIEAIAQMNNSSAVSLVVVGGDEPKPFQALADSLGIGEQITFAGKQSDMRSYYVAADILLYPSLYEPFANVCLEACACRLPVLTTKPNGSSELIEHGVSGYIVDRADNVAAMQLSLEAFTAMDCEQKKTMADAAFAASEGYSWLAHVDALEQLFNDIKQKK